MIIVDSCLCACSTMCRAYSNHVLHCFERQQPLDTGAFIVSFRLAFGVDVSSLDCESYYYHYTVLILHRGDNMIVYVQENFKRENAAH